MEQKPLRKFSIGALVECVFNSVKDLQKNRVYTVERMSEHPDKEENELFFWVKLKEVPHYLYPEDFFKLSTSKRKKEQEQEQEQKNVDFWDSVAE